jgi:hypothetical protein
MTPTNDVSRQRGDFVLQLRKFRAVRPAQQITARRKHLTELDEHGPELLACAAQMLRTRAITGFVLDELIVNDVDTVTREYSQDLAVALALRNHSAKPDQTD